MSVARFIASQRTEHSVPHTVCCRALDVSESWFYKWNDREPTPRRRRREQLIAAIGKEFEDSGRTYGSPRIGLELREKGWRVSNNTIAVIMPGRALTWNPTMRVPARARHASGLASSSPIPVIAQNAALFVRDLASDSGVAERRSTDGGALASASSRRSSDGGHLGVSTDAEAESLVLGDAMVYCNVAVTCRRRRWAGRGRHLRLRATPTPSTDADPFVSSSGPRSPAGEITYSTAANR
ncbi:IS3 family transposase [Nocardia abscessus]|uniref:IS3 family transposase n=1 Tax=Nocardia abscessus TaxID=120957 RepID=UPI0024580950|nr:IS3 family transposase [Nocardia abscessus]